MKLFILTIAKEQTYYSFDFEKDISVYKNIYTGVFNSRNKAETVAKKYLDSNSPFDVNIFYITECELNDIEEIGKECISELTEKYSKEFDAGEEG